MRLLYCNDIVKSDHHKTFIIVSIWLKIVDRRKVSQRLQALRAMECPSSTPSIVYVLTVIAVIGGFLVGYNTGVVSGALVILRTVWIDIDDWWQSAITSSTTGSAAVFALLSGWINEKLGRRTGLILSAILFLVGPLMCGMSHCKEMLLTGRIVVGMAIGEFDIILLLYCIFI